jgi:uncharacterized protein YxjI
MQMSTPSASGPASLPLGQHSKLVVKQMRELAELFGFETRNKYQVLDERGGVVAFAAEQQKGMFGFLMRQFLGHWRSFEFHIFDAQKRKVMTARQPFRIFFQRLEVMDENGRMIGAIQKRFSILTKRFDVQDPRGMPVMECASPIFRIWTFPFKHAGKQVACITKKWTGLLAEAFTDKDTFLVDYSDPGLTENERKLVLAAALYIDLRYFESKAGGD